MRADRAWNEHDGNGLPVALGTLVDVMFEDGVAVENIPAGTQGAYSWDWRWDFHPVEGCAVIHIVAWRLAANRDGAGLQPVSAALDRVMAAIANRMEPQP